MITTREQADVFLSLDDSDVHFLQLEGEGGENSKDLEGYIASQLRLAARLFPLPSSPNMEQQLDIDKLCELIAEKSSGNFLYASRLLESVKRDMRENSKLGKSNYYRTLPQIFTFHDSCYFPRSNSEGNAFRLVLIMEILF